MRVIFAAAELSPVATVGGLAAAAAGLTRELRHRGVDIDIVVPDYGDIALSGEVHEALAVPDWAAPASVRIGEHPEVGRLHLVSVPGMARPHPYLQPDGSGWHDNDARFMAFSQAIAALVRSDPPDVLHLNDWHTAAALAALDDSVPSVLSIHNLAYQGHGASIWSNLIGARADAYEWYGGINALCGGIALASVVVAVSPTYAREITTPSGGFGLDEVLRGRRGPVLGILNGIDTEIWDPRRDPYLAMPFDAASLDGKYEAKAQLIERLGFVDDTRPLAVMVTRLTHQKGVDLIVPLIGVLGQLPMRLAILGSGDAALAATLHEMVAHHGDDLCFVEGYDEALSHQMFAGADLYLMPSRFEPCGLTQMQAMRYGTIPVVTAVGGLVDTVPDVDRHPRAGHGFVAPRPEPVDIALAVERAVRRVGDRRRRTGLQQRIMGRDWSWRRPADEYLAVYHSLVGTG